MLLNRLHRNLPSEDRVALRTVRAELSAVYVGVTIGAIFSNVRENRLGMASRAGHLFVHTAKRIPRGVVIEFGNGANGSPARVGVAIFAGNVQRTVRAAAWLPLCIHRATETKYKGQENEQNTELSDARNDCPLTL